jgi:hypothetical protein
VKSASYALHDPTLSNLKKFILDNSQFVLQDDTGVPFADFDKKWNKFAFGTYTEPTLTIFKGYKQHSLVEFFKHSEKVKIPFKMGYGYNQCRPNLVLAIPNKSAEGADIIDSTEDAAAINGDDISKKQKE